MRASFSDQASRSPTLIRHRDRRPALLCPRTSAQTPVGFAPTVGMGAYGNHPHAHVLIALPTVASRTALDQSIIRAIRKTRLINREFQISAYLNDGGARYLVEHGTDRMVVPLLTPAWTE